MESHLNLISQKSWKTGFVSSIDFPPVFEGLFPICHHHPYSTPWGWVTWIFSTPLHSSVPIVRTAEKHATNRRERWQKTLLSKAALLTIIDQLELSWKIHVAPCPAHIFYVSPVTCQKFGIPSQFQLVNLQSQIRRRGKMAETIALKMSAADDPMLVSN